MCAQLKEFKEKKARTIARQVRYRTISEQLGVYLGLYKVAVQMYCHVKTVTPELVYVFSKNRPAAFLSVADAEFYLCIYRTLAAPVPGAVLLSQALFKTL